MSECLSGWAGRPTNHIGATMNNQSNSCWCQSGHLCFCTKRNGSSCIALSIPTFLVQTCIIGPGYRDGAGLSSARWWYSLGSHRYHLIALRAVHEKKINFKPIISTFVQKFLVPCCSRNNTVFSLKDFLESILRYSFEVVFSVETKDITDG